jgi:hypothetical protein
MGIGAFLLVPTRSGLAAGDVLKNLRAFATLREIFFVLIQGGWFGSFERT